MLDASDNDTVCESWHPTRLRRAFLVIQKKERTTINTILPQSVFHSQGYERAENGWSGKCDGQVDREVERVSRGYVRYTAEWAKNMKIIVHCDSSVMKGCEGEGKGKRLSGRVRG